MGNGKRDSDSDDNQPVKLPALIEGVLGIAETFANAGRPAEFFIETSLRGDAPCIFCERPTDRIAVARVTDARGRKVRPQRLCQDCNNGVAEHATSDE